MEREKHTQMGWGDRSAEEVVNDWISTPSVVRTDKDFNVKDYFIVTDEQMELFGIGIAVNRISVSGAAYSVSARDYILGVNRLAVAPTIGLPRPKLAGFGKTYIVKDEVGGALTTTITVVSQGEETIDGASSSTIITNYGAKSFYTDGANWFSF